jgi:hypothetical protein
MTWGLGVGKASGQRDYPAPSSSKPAPADKSVSRAVAALAKPFSSEGAEEVLRAIRR